MASREYIPLRTLSMLALEVGSLLNVEQDDDRRELLQEHFERVLNDELWAGSQNRNAIRWIYAGRLN